MEKIDKIDKQVNVAGNYFENKAPDNQTNLPIPNEAFEKAIDNFLQATITPAIQPYKEALIQRFKFAFEEIENEIERAKEEVRYELMNYHFEKIQQKMKEDGTTISAKETSKAEAVEKAELIKEWIEGIGNIDEKDKELSDIWEGWFLEMNKDPKIAEQKQALEVMKELSTEEAQMMLSFNYRYMRFDEKKIYEYKRNKSPIFLRILSKDKKAKFISNQLINKRLVENVSMLNRINPIFLITAILSLLFYGVLIGGIYSKWNFYFLLQPVFLLSAISVLSITVLILLIKRKQLTWLGEIIVSYAKQCTKNDKE